MDVSDLHRRPAPLDACTAAQHEAPVARDRGQRDADAVADFADADASSPTPPTDLFVAGLVVHAQPSRLAAVEQAIAALPSAEVHGVSLVGKLAVTLEQTNESTLMAQVQAIGRLRGVLSAVMVYQHSEPLIDVEEEFT